MKGRGVQQGGSRDGIECGRCEHSKLGRQKPGATPTAILHVAPALPCFSASVELTHPEGRGTASGSAAEVRRPVGRSGQLEKSFQKVADSWGWLTTDAFVETLHLGFPFLYISVWRLSSGSCRGPLSLCKITNSFLGIERQACLL